mmetsp:Transcript_35858/g.54997  ORF Transcript_35858/g.54997 Transcript_35858/m.54997 type:complete len:150 (-) Transcript_35858:949-1398(-)
MYESMENDFDIFLQSVLFSAMGNANKIKNSLEQIEEYQLDQQKDLIANEYGQLLNILLSFETVSTASLDDGPKVRIPELERFRTIERAFIEAQKYVSAEMIEGWESITTGEKAAAAVTIASGLGIAAVYELNDRGILTNDMVSQAMSQF